MEKQIKIILNGKKIIQDTFVSALIKLGKIINPNEDVQFKIEKNKVEANGVIYDLVYAH